MIKQFIFCNNSICNTNITETIENMDSGYEYLQKHMITIRGKYHYCDEDCKKVGQSECGKMTNHQNSVKDRSQGECLDCGLTYADPNL